MNTLKCRVCKKYFDKDINIITKIKYQDKIYIYYICNTCNTKRFKKYRHTKNGKENTNKAVKKSTKKYQYKQNARKKLRSAIITNKIIKPKICSHCLEEKIVEGHHFNYNNPLEVIWLCRKCHNLFHKNML